MPASRLFFALGAVTLLLIAGLLSPALAVLAIVLDLGLVAAFWLDLRAARRTALTAERQWPALLVQGAPAEVRVTLAGAPAQERARESGSRALVVELREGLEPALAPAPLRTRLTVPAGGRATWTYTLVPRRRGEPEIAPLTARILGPAGLAWAQRDLLAGERRRIYPRVRWEGKVGHLLALAQRHQLGEERTPLQGAGSESYGLREYLPGDPPVKIHWKATARHGRLVTREETWERGARLLLLLDCARTMTPRDPEDPAGQMTKLDHALAASLALARVAAARGDRVTFIAFSHQIERVVRLTSGRRALETAYGSLFDLEAKLSEPAYDLAAREALRHEGRAATVVLFTSVVDLGAAELLRTALLSLERRHRPILVNLEDPELAALAREPPASAAEAFAQVDALEILLANRRLGKSLRRSGVRVVSTPADRLALASLEAYLALFRVNIGGKGRLRAAG